MMTSLKRRLRARCSSTLNVKLTPDLAWC